jgi:hypothetical protein
MVQRLAAGKKSSAAFLVSRFWNTFISLPEIQPQLASD